MKVQFPNSNIDRERYDNRTAPCILWQAGPASLRKYVYGNGFTVMERERISGTVFKERPLDGFRANRTR